MKYNPLIIENYYLAAIELIDGNFIQIEFPALEILDLCPNEFKYEFDYEFWQN